MYTGWYRSDFRFSGMGILRTGGLLGPRGRITICLSSIEDARRCCGGDSTLPLWGTTSERDRVRGDPPFSPPAPFMSAAKAIVPPARPREYWNSKVGKGVREWLRIV